MKKKITLLVFCVVILLVLGVTGVFKRPLTVYVDKTFPLYREAVQDFKVKNYENLKIKIVTFAYLRCLEPPKLEKLHPNLVIKLCTYRRCYKCRINDPECTINQNWNKLLIDWSKFGNEISIYDYLKLGNSPEFPVPMMKVIQQDLQYYRTLGITGYETELIVDGGPVILAAPNFKGKGFYRSKPADHERYWTGAKLIFYLLLLNLYHLI